MGKWAPSGQERKPCFQTYIFSPDPQSALEGIIGEQDAVRLLKKYFFTGEHADATISEFVDFARLVNESLRAFIDFCRYYIAPNKCYVPQYMELVIKVIFDCAWKNLAVKSSNLKENDQAKNVNIYFNNFAQQVPLLEKYKNDELDKNDNQTSQTGVNQSTNMPFMRFTAENIYILNIPQENNSKFIQELKDEIKKHWVPSQSQLANDRNASFSREKREFLKAIKILGPDPSGLKGVEFSIDATVKQSCY
jgi:hypothetical protein